MKSIVIRGFAASILSILAVSCYKDLSTEANTSLPDLVISADADVINAYYGEVIYLEPGIMMKGRTAKDFEFLWEIDLQPGRSTDRIAIGEERTLTYKVGNTPSTTPYTLSLTATDKVTGLAAVNSWEVYVSSSLGEGLLVGYTRDGGLTSEIDLIAGPSLTYGYTGSIRYTRELYALANGAPLDGRIQTISSIAFTNGAVFNQNLIMVGTQKDMIGIDPLTFTASRKNDDFFNLPLGVTTFNMPTFFSMASYSCGCIVNGNLYVSLCNISNSLSLASHAVQNYHVDTKCIAHGKMAQEDLFHFEKTTGKFYMIQGWNCSQSSFSEQKFSISFDAKGAESVAAGASKESCYSFIIKDASGKYHWCLMNGDDNKYEDHALNDSKLDNMVCSTFCDNSNVFFFSDGNKIYSKNLAGDTIIERSLSWAPDSEDEKITGLTQYLQAWYGCNNLWDYEFTLDSHRTQILVTTYNSKTGEGKIYMRGYNAATGLFTSKNYGTLTGFGEITAVGTSFR